MKRLMMMAVLVTCMGTALAGAPPKTTPELIAKGKTAYTTNCMACHGDKGDGNGPAGAMLNPKPRDLRVKSDKPGAHYKNGGKPEQLFKSISEGLPGTAMAPFSGIPEADRWAIIAYIQSSFQGAK